MLTLTLVRHAKASRDDSSVKDFDRPLNERGKLQSDEMGALLQQRGVAPDLILCSTAKRTQQTLNRLLKRWPSKAEVVLEGRLYLAPTEKLLALIGKCGKTHKHVMVIGHNPGLHLLAFSLAERGDPGQLRSLAEKFPTLGVCSIRFETDSWKKLANGELVLLTSPKIAAENAAAKS
jgi:phosphohistidine phosphatase